MAMPRGRLYEKKEKARTTGTFSSVLLTALPFFRNMHGGFDEKQPFYRTSVRCNIKNRSADVIDRRSSRVISEIIEIDAPEIDPADSAVTMPSCTPQDRRRFVDLTLIDDN